MTVLSWFAAATIKQPPPPSVGDAVPELVVAGVLVLLGLRSAWKVTRVRLELDTLGEHVLYAVHVTARIRGWFVLAAFFVGVGLVDDAQSLAWLLLVLLGLAGVQLLTSFFLGRS